MLTILIAVAASASAQPPERPLLVGLRLVHEPPAHAIAITALRPQDSSNKLDEDLHSIICAASAAMHRIKSKLPHGLSGYAFTGGEPHVMVVGADPSFYDAYPKAADPDTSVPYIMWAGTPYQHLMAPVK